ncbi:hypothetical protein [Bradyrhizobium sp. WSM471]|uniref:hypothetical protein n=1 Tax=Bradyrhizobium sp. WSM471 TaxID=319017 RepID=UPI00024D1BE8|nr:MULTISPECIES: hypothetical protein [Bradyrhizobium]EHR00088.1 hypothetical protein Bra471DRAFT_00625 [Bradyrhizobium sp. WSM471]UFW42215.1 hypothetical protein BcanWSM471_03085 [Bradyrhizobium canariense]
MTKRTRRPTPARIIGDEHAFIARVFCLAIPLELGLSNNQQLNRHPDCLYVMRVYWRLSFLVQRVESINVALKMLRLRNLPISFLDFPLSRYEWLTVATDTFLMRFVSVFDCCLLLTDEVFECGLDPRACTLEALRKKAVPANVVQALESVFDTSTQLRNERNWRFHRGEERAFTNHDHAFRAISAMEAWGHSWKILDAKRSRETDLVSWFSTALAKLTRECNKEALKIPPALAALYETLTPEFESRFASKVKARKTSLPWYQPHLQLKR